MGKNFKTYFIIIFLSTISALYLFESYLLIKEKNIILKKAEMYKKKTGKSYDLRSKFEVYNDLKNDKEKVTLSMTAWSKIFLDKNDLLPLSGLSNIKSILCNENGYYSSYLSDRYGFNNPDKEWDKKSIDYLVLGDSFAHGACVNRPNDISSVLRSLSKKNVLNLGISGNGPLTEYATLREYKHTNVKNIIWIYFEGYDLADLINEKKNFILMNYIKDENFSQNLRNRNDAKDQVVKKITKKEYYRIVEKYSDDNKLKYKILKFIRLDKTKKVIFVNQVISEEINERVFKDFKDILALTKIEADKMKSKLYFVYLPEFLRLSENYSNKNYYKVLKIVNDLDIPVIDLKKNLLDKEKNPFDLYPFGMNAHFNVKGYRKSSQIILENIKD